MVPILILVVIVAAVGLAAWYRREGASSSLPSGAQPTPSPLERDLGRWVDAGLLGRDQAAEIVAFERRAAPPPRRISLATEALGYVGAALATAGAFAAVGQVWEDLSGGMHLALTAGAAVALVAAGASTIRSEEPAYSRLGSVLWFLAVAAIAGALSVLAIELLELTDSLADVSVALIITSLSAAAAAVLWWFARSALQQGAMFATVLAAVVAAILWLPGDVGLWAPALGVWALGLVWVGLGWWQRMAPRPVALALGAAAVLFGPTMGIDESGWMLIPALAAAAAAMAVSIPTRLVPLLVAGTAGLFLYLTWAVVRYFGDTLGVPLALVLVGALFIGLAVVASRLRRLADPSGPGPLTATR